ncbi:MAG: sugar phosphate nucleotidyltransferase [Gammaproteobacteria bacterium]
MAGGEGTRLNPLTADRSKPSVKERALPANRRWQPSWPAEPAPTTGATLLRSPQ